MVGAWNTQGRVSYSACCLMLTNTLILSRVCLLHTFFNKCNKNLNCKITVWYLKFFEWWNFMLWYSGLWHRAVWYVVYSITGEYNASFFRVEDRWRMFIRKPGTYCLHLKVTWWKQSISSKHCSHFLTYMLTQLRRSQCDSKLDPLIKGCTAKKHCPCFPLNSFFNGRTLSHAICRHRAKHNATHWRTHGCQTQTRSSIDRFMHSTLWALLVATR